MRGHLVGVVAIYEAFNCNGVTLSNDAAVRLLRDDGPERCELQTALSDVN
jgi:hypothetical protein